MFDRQAITNISGLLFNKKFTIAVSESVTAGLLQAALSTGENASFFFEGGVTTYNIRQKFKHLNIDLAEAAATNCVSPVIAEHLALGVERMFAADFGMSVTGYASPLPGHNQQEVYAWYAITFHGRCVACDKLIAEVKEPFDVQVEYTNRLLNALAVAVEIIAKE